jgi:hypothetical protein
VSYRQRRLLDLLCIIEQIHVSIIDFSLSGPNGQIDAPQHHERGQQERGGISESLAYTGVSAASKAYAPRLRTSDVRR